MSSKKIVEKESLCQSESFIITDADFEESFDFDDDNDISAHSNDEVSNVTSGGESKSIDSCIINDTDFDEPFTLSHVSSKK